MFPWSRLRISAGIVCPLWEHLEILQEDSEHLPEKKDVWVSPQACCFSDLTTDEWKKTEG